MLHYACDISHQINRDDVVCHVNSHDVIVLVSLVTDDSMSKALKRRYRGIELFQHENLV